MMLHPLKHVTMRQDMTLTCGTWATAVLHEPHRWERGIKVFETISEPISVILVARQQECKAGGSHSDDDGKNFSRSA